MQESAFGCRQLAAVMRWHPLIEHPAKGEAVIGRRGEQGERVLTERWRARLVAHFMCALEQKFDSFTLSPLCSQRGEADRQKLQRFLP